ncbi:MAG: hypothetical protein GQ570_00490 [Helicobacteraceae bacterium]|nr:hypothetical protein [Helicobacteraceae bacterium]
MKNYLLLLFTVVHLFNANVSAAITIFNSNENNQQQVHIHYHVHDGVLHLHRHSHLAKSTSHNHQHVQLQTVAVDFLLDLYQEDCSSTAETTQRYTEKFSFICSSSLKSIYRPPITLI